MLPFMEEELYTILGTLLEKFVKKSVFDQATTAAKLSKIDVLKKENLLSPKKVDVENDFLVKSNAMRSKSVEQRKEIENKQKNIDDLHKKLKLM